MSDLPQLFLLLENPRKGNNLGPLLRCASGFGIVTVVAVGFEKCGVQGSHGASKHVQIIAFPTAKQAVTFLRSECQCESIIGILGACPGAYESARVYQDHQLGLARIADTNMTTTRENDILTKESFPVNVRPFSKVHNVCFAVDKDRRGLALSLALYCDTFVHVPHHNYGFDAMPTLLDCPSCLSIALHEFTEHAGYNERKFQGHKFQVTPRHQLQMNRQDDRNRKSERIREKQQREQEAEAAVEDGTLSNLFGVDVLASTNGDY